MKDKNASLKFSFCKSFFFVSFIFSFAVLYIFTSVSAGGTDFASSSRNKIILGKTDKEEVVRLFGNPNNTEIVLIRTGLTHELFTYKFIKGTPPEIPLARELFIEFKKDTVNGYFFVSTFPEDGTTFDTTAADKITDKKTIKSDVLLLLGQPHEKALLPTTFVSRQTTGIENATEVWGYAALNKRDPDKKSIVSTDELTIFFDARDIVLKTVKNFKSKMMKDDARRYGFLNFLDAASCQDYGDLTPLKNPSSTIIQLPFLLRCNQEGKVSKESYPATEIQIDSYIKAAIEKNHKTQMIDPKSPRAQVIGAFLQGVMSKVGDRDDFPLEWGHDIPEGSLDKNTYIYFPIGIEREIQEGSQHNMNARFYVLIANPRGKVIFARCLPYNPNAWSGDIEAFEKDVKGKLPLAE